MKSTHNGTRELPVAEATPARGTRPRNRRNIILAAAADLFAANGYGNVAMQDIADAVNVGPPALYRHFPSKQEILREAILRGSRLRREAVEFGDATALTDILLDLAKNALSTRTSVLLWTNEIRNLDEDDRTEIRADYRSVATAMEEKLADARPELASSQVELLSWAALIVLASTAFHGERLPVNQFVEVLCTTMHRIVWMELPPASTEPTKPPGPVVRESKREVVLQAAGSLFARHGYSAVTVEDIGAASGSSGAGIYTFFNGKQSLIDALIVRSIEWQEAAYHAHLRGVTGPRERLYALIDAEIDFTYSQPTLARLARSDFRHMSQEQAKWVEQHRRENVREMVGMIDELDPDRDPTVARIQIHASRTVTLDVLTTSFLRTAPDLLDIVRAACRATLDI